MKSSLILFGIPRSGTTWLANTLKHSGIYHYVHEPDNEGLSWNAVRFKPGLPRFPYVRPNASENALFSIYDVALNKSLLQTQGKANGMVISLTWPDRHAYQEDLRLHGTISKKSRLLPRLLHATLPKSIKKSDQPRFIKSVHSCLSIPYLLNRFDFKPMIIFRHPASVISSYLYMGMADGDRSLYNYPELKEDYLQEYQSAISEIKSDPLALMGLQVAIFYLVMEKAINNFSIPCYYHEDLCEHPIEKFKKVYADFEIPWTSQVEKVIAEQNSGGEGYDTRRIAVDQIDIWKKRLNAAQIRSIQKGWSVIPVNSYADFRIESKSS